MEHISHLPVKVPQILASDLLVPGRASPNVGAVGAFLDAEEAHVRKNLPLRHEGDSNNGGRQDEIGKLPKPIPFLEEDVESVEEEQQYQKGIHASVETGYGVGEVERHEEAENHGADHQAGREIGKHHGAQGLEDSEQDEQGDQDVVQDGVAPLPFGIGHGGDRHGEGIVGANLPLIGLVDLFRGFSRLPLLDRSFQYCAAPHGWWSWWF